MGVSNDAVSTSRPSHPPSAENAAPQASFRVYNAPRPLSATPTDGDMAQHHPPSGDGLAAAITRLQSQVSYNTNIIDSQRSQIAEIEQTMHSLHAHVERLGRAINDIRAGMRSGVDHNVPPPEDLEVLASQITQATNKANEVDSLKMQVKLLTNRLRRFEDGAAVSTASPPTFAPRAQTPLNTHDVAQSAAPAQHPSLPPMRMPVMSPAQERGPINAVHSHMPHVPLPQGEQPHAGSRYRPVEPLTHPPAVTLWRSHEHSQPAIHPGPSTSAQLPRSTAVNASGWRPVNVRATSKRPSEDTPNDQPSSAPGSPKRTKLTAILPRSSHGTDSGASVTSDSPRMATEEIVKPASIAPRPGAAPPSAYRFMPPTAPADAGEWKQEGALANNGRTGGRPEEEPHNGSGLSRGRGQQNSGSGKKTRTKPTRNADGILIRKDGNPDMRSISSVNNLRKVSAKKEAERAELAKRNAQQQQQQQQLQEQSIEENGEEEGPNTRQSTPKDGASEASDAEP
ncbi:hypothetical protein K470DRAFT_258638 [Piedraia hortae CBS 480.64]|uniref:Uncharacterized protein n=1 Tax=Piedraia hortae CBS 480.64 TaxID=1314780 RepID=A0A6A7BY33_9PEZI|nr:hypothetical protein K470DRAFT_258638 [Piedraia hortae CBS 480.64]